MRVLPILPFQLSRKTICGTDKSGTILTCSNKSPIKYLYEDSLYFTRTLYRRSVTIRWWPPGNNFQLARISISFSMNAPFQLVPN